MTERFFGCALVLAVSLLAGCGGGDDGPLQKSNSTRQVGGSLQVIQPTSPPNWQFLSSPASIPQSFSSLGIFAAAWQPDANQYAVSYSGTPMPPADTFHVGQGYWIFVTNPVSIPGPGTFVDSTRPFSIVLKTGWNQVGDPFNNSVPLSNLSLQINGGSSIPFTTALANNQVSPLYPYNSATGVYIPLTSSSQTLDPWLGAWIYTFTPATLVVNPPAGGNTGGGTGSTVSVSITPNPTYANPEVGVQPLGLSPTALAVDTAANKTYAADSNSYQVVDSSAALPFVGATGAKTTVSGGISTSTAHSIGVDSGGPDPFLWVARNSGVAAVLLGNGSVLGSLSLNSVSALVIDSSARKVYAALDHSISVISEDATANQQSVTQDSSINTGNGFLGDMALDTSSHKLFVASDAGLKMLDPSNGSVQTFTAMKGGSVAVNPTNHLVYQIVSTGFDSPGVVSILDPSTGAIRQVNIGRAPVGLAVNPTTGYVYIANSGSEDVSILSPRGVVTMAPLKDASGNSTSPSGPVVFNPATSQVFVGLNSNNMAVLDGSAAAADASAPLTNPNAPATTGSPTTGQATVNLSIS